REEEAEMSLVLAQKLDHLVHRAAARHPPHLGMLAGKGGEPSRQELRRDVAMDRDRDLLGLALPQRRERVRGLLGLAQHVDREGVDRLARLGELRLAATVAIEQRLADLRLQR